MRAVTNEIEEGVSACGDTLFRIGDEVFVRCRIVGPPLLDYGVQGVILDLVPLNSRGEADGGQFTTAVRAVTPAA